MTNKFIAIIQTGQAIESVLDKYGDFDDWFIKGMNINRSQTRTYRVYQELSFPEIQDVAGIIVTGSASMVTQELDWSEETIRWLRPLLTLNIPILGVCYGHQMLVKLLGGKVGWNPNGRQIGQIEMCTNQDTLLDPLFENIFEENISALKFLATHQQSALVMPEDVIQLGSTDLDPNHCFRYKNHIWGLQFHPEFSEDVMKGYIKARAKDIEQEGQKPDQLIEKIEPSNIGSLLLQAFKKHCGL